MTPPASATRARAGTRPVRRRPTSAQRQKAAAARRRKMRARRAGVATIALAAMIAIGLVVSAVIGAIADGRSTGAPGGAEYEQEQRDNAALIMAAGRDLGLPVRDQAIGVMTAMGESSLRNIDYGDWETSGVTNPDGTRTTSIGLFQQQDSWGTREQRLDPYTSASLFYRALVARVPDRESVAPTLVAHRTQVNRNADHYAPYWPEAIALVEELSGVESGLVE